MTVQLGGAATPIPRVAWRTLAVTSTVVFMVSLEITIISLALPEIRGSYPGTSNATLSWILTAYSIGVASFLLLAGWWADKSGRKRVFLLGLVAFALGSLVAATAPSIEVLLFGRVVQSIGGAIQYPAGLALLLAAFPTERRQTAIGIWGAMGALAAAIGPSLGAVLVEGFGWRSIFFVNLPVAGAALVAGVFWLVEGTGEVPSGRVDLLGVPLASFGTGAIILAIVQTEGWGFASLAQIVTLGLGVILVSWFFIRARTHPVPLFDLNLFLIRSYRNANLAAVLFTMAFFAWLVTLPIFIQDQWNWSVLQTGFALVPGPLIAVVSSPPLGRLADRIGPRPVIMIGAASGAIGVSLQRAVTTLEPNYVLMLLIPAAFVGLAAGSCFAMLVAAALQDIAPSNFGMAGAGRSTIYQLATALGIALGFGLISGTDTSQAALDRYGWLWIACAALYLGVLVIFWRFFGPEPSA